MRAGALLVLLLTVRQGELGGPSPSDGPRLPARAKVPGQERVGTPFKPLRTLDGTTRCAACHLVDGWEKVRFNHDPTGFPLRGAHVAVACGGCHPKDFVVPVADTCAGCHRDRHAGEFGAFCEGCHDSQSWRPLFDADAHRRTNFPLVGKHALIPCQQCHGDMRDRTFTRAPVRCVGCHQTDYAQAGLRSIDHVAARFSLECQTCHDTRRFLPAQLPGHGTCFRIASGSHHGIRCLGCHSNLTGATVTGACATGTFSCSGCHTHECARSAPQHTNVMGYECTDSKCYTCHKITGS